MKNVLLLGNGIDRAYDSNAVSWSDLLKKMTTVPNLPKHETLPFPLEMVLRTNDHVDEALKKYNRDLYGSAEDEKLRCVLAKVLEMGFDEILTTNYDYALEGTAIYPKKVTDAWLRNSMKHTDEVARAENTYLLHTYQEVGSGDAKNRIWHIHGEARKPGSIVIGHYMYVNLVSKWREKLAGRVDKYRAWDKVKADAFAAGPEKAKADAFAAGPEKAKADSEPPCGSWLDSFVLGKVYILGLGMDFSELDLWWLLNRKKREKAAHGKVVFYEPERTEDAAKYALLRAYGAEVRHLGFKLPERMEAEACDEDLQAEFDEQEREAWKFTSEVYKAFYVDALEDIERDILKNINNSKKISCNCILT